MTREFVLPHLLHMNPATMDADLPYFSLVYPYNSEQMTDFEIEKSMRAFAERISAGPINELMSHHRLGKSIRTPPNFRVSAVGKGRNDVGEKGWGSFYVDPNRGFALGVEANDGNSTNTLWIGVLGFTMGKELSEYDYENRHHLRGVMGKDIPLPTIVQIQGPNLGKESRANTYHDLNSEKEEVARNKRAKQVISRYDWAAALIDISLEWARSEGIPAVYLLPADKNRYDYSGHNLASKYSIPAEKLGFRMRSSGLYAISLIQEVNPS